MAPFEFNNIVTKVWQVVDVAAGMQDEYKNESGSVIAADFYHANTLLPLSDAEIVAKVKQNLGICEPAFQSAQVISLLVSTAGLPQQACCS